MVSSASRTIVWFRQDLRLADNPALAAAAAEGRPVVPVYILDTATEAAMGAASLWWLHHSLAALRDDLEARCGLVLLLKRGDPATILPALVRDTKASAVHWNRVYEPAAIARDTALKAALRQDGLAVETHNSALLFEPWTVKTKTGGWFKVFSPFWRACQLLPPPPAPLPAPKRLTAADIPEGDRLEDWQLLPARPDWAGGLRDSWKPGEAGAAERLGGFIDHALAGYAQGRDRPGSASTSRLSPHLHFGEIGPRQIWQAVRMAADHDGGRRARDAEKFLAEIGWREFSHHLLYHFPQLPDRNFREDFDAFPWQDDTGLLHAWQRGRTGYPLVDAGMRELWHTGWMHNRVRMVVASFLVKHLRLHWHHGEAWFWDTLVDADLANNAASWQWVAGSGADAAPYFRVFNPSLQGEKFDPDGAYVRRWVPELAALPAKYIHRPWQAPAEILHQAGIELGRSYPRPIVDHDRARHAALAAFASLRDGNGNEQQKAGTA